MGRCALGLLLASALVGCRSPTQITVDVQTDVPCTQVTSTAFTAGELGALESLPATSTSTTCSGGYLGTVVLVPSGSENAEVGFKLVTALNGTTTDACSGAAAANDTSCIVARRALRYIPNTPLEVIVDMTKVCEGTVCSAESTCVNGACVPATIPDPTQCEVGCNSSVLVPEDAGVSSAGDAGPDATVDAGVDATVEAGGDATADAGASDTGVDASDTGAEDAAPDADAGGIDDAGGACEAGAQECESNAAVRMCTVAGLWGGAMPCATGECASGACKGATSGATFPSCAGGGAGRSDCGEDGGDDCCESLEVPGGTYTRTDSYNLGAPSSATLNGFRLDKYLVTVGRFRQFVSAWNGGAGLTGGAGFEPDAGWGKHAYLNAGLGLIDVGVDGGAFEPGSIASDDTILDPTDSTLACATANSDWMAGRDALPMNCVDWHEAVAFCIWDGGFLPSEAESLFASAGGSDELLYPWGATNPTTQTPNEYAIFGGFALDGGPGYGCYYPTGLYGECDGGNLAPVRSAPAGAAPWGHLDMSGEVFEWTLDLNEFYVDTCVDCAYVTGTKATRATHGGSFHDNDDYMASLKRWYSSVPGRTVNVGFRCARAP